MGAFIAIGLVGDLVSRGPNYYQHSSGAKCSGEAFERLTLHHCLKEVISAPLTIETYIAACNF